MNNIQGGILHIVRMATIGQMYAPNIRMQIHQTVLPDASTYGISDLFEAHSFGFGGSEKLVFL